MNTTLRQRLLAAFMAALLAVSMMPAWAFANGDSQVQQTTDDLEQNVDQNAGDVSGDAARRVPSGDVAASGEADGSNADSIGFDGAVPGDPSSQDVSKDALAEKSSLTSSASSGEPMLLSASSSSAAPSIGASSQSVDHEISVTCSIVGIDSVGNRQSWAPAQGFEIPDGATAADVTVEMFKRTGITADYDPDGEWGFYLSSITSPFDGDQTLSYDPATGKYWQLFINKTAALAGASSCILQPGDSVVWCYSAWDEAAPSSQLSVKCEIVGEDAAGNQQIWAAPTTILVDEGSSAADLSKALFAEGVNAGFTEGVYGFSLDWIESPFDPALCLSSEKVSNDPEPWGTYAYWQLFINGEYSSLGASSCILKAGDTVSWVYGSDASMPGQISVSMDVIGRDADGVPQRWARAANQVFLAGTSLREASGVYLKSCGMSPLFNDGASWSLESLSSPLGDGRTLQSEWYFFVNGIPGSQLGADYELKSGDSVVWAFGSESEIPDPDEVIVDPAAPRPDWEADWAGDASQPTRAETPVDSLKDAWIFDYAKYATSGYAKASEPIVVNGFVYLAVDNRMLKIDASTGKVLATSNLKGSIGYTARPVYAKGVVIVPLDGGAVQALTADELATAWVTDPVSEIAQSSCSISVKGNYAYVGAVDVDYGSGTYNNGHFMRINILTGAISWKHVNPNEGYYWGGSAFAGGYVVVATSSGTLEVLSQSSGALVDSLSLGVQTNSSCAVSDDGSTVYVVTYDGMLHVFGITDNGSLSEKRSVPLGLAGSACMPTKLGDKLIVGGWTELSSALAVVDLNSFEVQLVTAADGAVIPAGFGGIKGAPLVSVQKDGVYVYFTVNFGESEDYVTYTSGGGVYCYKLGDVQAKLLYDAAGHNNYCDSPVACDKNGSLYYINDSMSLFKLVPNTSNPGGGAAGGEGSAAGGGSSIGDNGDAGSAGNGSTAGVGSVPNGTVAPANLPVSLGESVAEAIAEAEALEKAGADTAEAVALSARAAGLAVEDGSDAPAWAYVVLGTGVVAALGAAVWFVAARRRVV